MTNPKYPVYIISKGRHETMITSRSLNRMRVPHYISVEPQDLEPYTEAVKKFKLDMVTLLELPFSNHGDGPGRARNWCWIILYQSVPRNIGCLMITLLTFIDYTRTNEFVLSRV